MYRSTQGGRWAPCITNKLLHLAAHGCREQSPLRQAALPCSMAALPLGASRSSPALAEALQGAVKGEGRRG